MRFLEFDSLASTNETAAELFRNGEDMPLWVRADSQTSGRGRRGRAWTSKSGNLFASLLYPWTGSATDAAKLSFVTSIALVKTLQAYPIDVAPKLKWPNDVLLKDAKVSGILLENLNGSVVIGVGVNLTSHPEGTPYPATHLLDHIPEDQMAGPEPAYTGPAPFLAILSRHLDDLIKLYLKDGFDPIRRAWLEHATGIPGTVTVRLTNESFSGQATDLLENGALRVVLPNGTIRDVHAGDVFFEGQS